MRKILFILSIILICSSFGFAQDSTTVKDTVIMQYESLIAKLQEQSKQAQIDIYKIQGAIETLGYLIEERKKTLRLRSGQEK